MRTRIQQVPVPALAGGLAVLGGVALWQLGIEFERAWMRSYDGPLEGETLAGEPLAETFAADRGGTTQRSELAQAIPAVGRQRRWVARHHTRVWPRVARVA